MGASQSSTYQPSITGLSKKDGKLVFKKIDDTEESIPIDTVSIQNVVVDSEGKLIITRTDGTQDGPFNIKGNTGEKGESIIGPKGDSIIGPKGDSIVGPPGKDSMIPGPKGDSIVGPQGEGIKDLTVSEQGFATITTTSDRKFGPFNVKGNTGATGSQGPPGKDSDLNYAKFESTMKSQSVWCDNGNCVTPGNSTVNGDISGKSIGRNSTDPDWFRIFGTKSGGTALYNGLSMGDGGLRVGDFNRVPNGQIEATGDIISGGQLKSAGTVTAFGGNRDLVGELDTINRNLYNQANGEIKTLGKIQASGDIISGGQLKSAGTVTAFGGNRDIIAELDILNRDCVRKSGKYTISNRNPSGWLLSLNGNVDGGSIATKEASWTFSDSPAP